MKKLFLVIGLLLLTNLANAQDLPKSKCDCANENYQLPDGVKYLKAQKDALEITPGEKRPLKVISDGDAIFLNFSRSAKDGSCTFTKAELDNFQKGGIWIFLPTEFEEVYQTKKDEFTRIGNANRLKKLLGLSPSDNSKCIVEIKIAGSKVIRPSIIPKNCETSNFFLGKWGDTSVFTALGYTCDWYYGSGCEYGLTEFNIPPNPPILKPECPVEKPEENYLEVKSSCTLDEYLNKNCHEYKKL